MNIFMEVTYVTLEEIARDHGREGWGGPHPISIDHDAFEAFLKERLEWRKPVKLHFKAFGQDAECRPIGSEENEKFGDKSLGFCHMFAEDYILFIIEKKDGRWTVAGNTLAVTEVEPEMLPSRELDEIFNRLTQA